MDGIIIIDKPAGPTSHDVVARARRVLKTRRIGHTGTLDPFATGVLVLLVGQATRLAQFVERDEKEYKAVVRFGIETDTGDKTGSAKLSDDDPARDLPFPASRLIEAAARFRGEIDQIPPMYSAKKLAGRKLYELARAGREIERKAVKLHIRRLEIIDPPKFIDHTSPVRIEVVCSAGTYIRTLAEDLGREIGVGAHLSELRRTRAGRFGLNQSVTLEQFEALENPQTALRPMTDAVAHLPAFILDANRVAKTRNGLATRFSGSANEGDVFKVLDSDGALVAVGVYDENENVVRPKVVLV